MTIGKRIKECRLDAENNGKNRLTQAQLATKIGVNRVSITNWESDEHSPDRDNAIKLADYFGVNQKWLISGGDQPKYLNNTLGRKIRAARLASGLNQREAADKARCTEGDLERWESDTETPTKSKVKYLEHAFELDVGELTGGMLDTPHVVTNLASKQAAESEPDADAYCTAQWEIDAINALRGMDDDRRRRALQDLADGAEFERLKRASSQH